MKPGIQRALEFIRAYQNADGGWGESCASYDEDTFMPGPSTPSQTAWAMLALLAGGDVRSEKSLQRGRIPGATQRPDGDWDEDYSTGTGFPQASFICPTRITATLFLCLRSRPTEKPKTSARSLDGPDPAQ